ncbi:MAG: 1,3-beta-glucanosyltransferase gas1 [Vezdaea aestivalis]|nr:MAG: 1,3-beta-glucanosyltransferase gas1 [Vezdaea aestivalis]
MRSVAFATAAVAALLSPVFADVDPIIIKGNKFFYKSNGTEFFMRGIAYQQEFNNNGSSTTTGDNKYTDPLADVNACKRDIPLLAQLKTNTIRTYAIDPTLNHDECMRLLQDAGIYVVSDLSQPGVSINRDTPSWDIPLFNRYSAVVDAMSKYNNVIGFFAGNEVANNISNTNSMPFVKAAVRDMKAYIKQKNYRPMYVGYAANDDKDIRVPLADYLDCGDISTTIEFWGYNIYSWCGKSTFKESGFDERTKDLAGYNIPAFFAEYGCNQVQPRLFDEVQALYGPDMTSVWSGGIVYMYFQEANNYGLVSISGNSVSQLPDFTSLSSQLAKATPSSVSADAYQPTNTAARSCPPSGTAWNASPSLPPSPNKGLCSCMVSGLGCVAASNLNADDTATLFGQVCGYNNGAYCVGIAKDGATGKYGAYSMCENIDKLSFAINAYYKAQGGSAQSCDFGGKAKVQSAAAASTCSALVSQAGPAGTGTVSVGAQGGAAATSTARKTGAGATTGVQRVEVGLLQISMYGFVAVLTAFCMIIL